MKKILFFSIFLIMVGCGESSKYPTEFSQEALNQKIYSINGDETTVANVLAQNKGKKIVLDIWASWCKDCIVSMPKTAKMQAEFPEVKFIMFSVDEEETKWKEGIEKVCNSK